ncbi:hypothetical protein P7M49_25505, partial [Vibrio parahaemolyticus]|nr:hypothetical protein [Vibrio parahaemolyticus]
LIRTAEDESVVGLQRIEEVDDEELPADEDAEALESTDENTQQDTPEAPAADDAEEGNEE